MASTNRQPDAPAAGARPTEQPSADPPLLEPPPPEPVWPKLVATIERARPTGLLAGMRIRKKLIVLHTVFSLLLATVLVLVMRPAVARILRQAEEHEARLVLSLLHTKLDVLQLSGASAEQRADAMDQLRRRLPGDVALTTGTAGELGLDAGLVRLLATESDALTLTGRAGAPRVIVRDATVAPDAELVYYSATVNMAGARTAVRWLFVLVVAALLVMYALIALSLEVFVLPRNVWRPIRAMLEADDAVREGRREGQVIPASLIPADELGQIMRSRNSTVSALREQERRLAEALIDLERVASDLQRKNHLLETAKRNLADADRLATLGVMSAGLAHEINTPLAVVKGLAEKLAAAPARGLAEGEAQLLLRVTARLERLSESLLDFARARPARTDTVDLRAIIDEAWTLVRLDREARGIALHNDLAGCTTAQGDPDRLLQVMVNLLRNAVDALRTTGHGTPPGTPTIRTTCATVERDGARWLSLRVADNGPGLPAELLGRLFEPFASTRLDDKGTGLGLAVSQGIVQEHGGLLTARNRPVAEGGGAVFEVLLPLHTQG